MAVPKKIEQNMEVVGRDGAHVGIVERIEGTDEIKLAKDDPDAGGQERYIPLAWLVHTEIKVHLKLTGDEAKARWSSFRSPQNQTASCTAQGEMVRWVTCQSQHLRGALPPAADRTISSSHRKTMGPEADEWGRAVMV